MQLDIHFDDARDIAYFKLPRNIRYSGFRDDFGPLNLSAIYRFCKFVEGLLKKTKQDAFALFLA